MTQIQISPGDVFSIPCGDERVGTGQVISINPVSPVFVYVHERIWEVGKLPTPTEICAGSVLLAANTFDALLSNGHWPIFGHVTINPAKMLVPRFKCLQDGQWFVEGFGGDQIGAAKPADQRTLRNRYVTSPMNLEDALKAHHGLKAWCELFDGLCYNNIQESGEALAVASRRVRWK